jgi:hypothetical protein
MKQLNKTAYNFSVSLILIPFFIILNFFARIPVDLSHFSLHFDSILSPKAPKYFILNVLKRSLILDQLAADSFEEECSVLNITLLVGPTAF